MENKEIRVSQQQLDAMGNEIALKTSLLTIALSAIISFGVYKYQMSKIEKQLQQVSVKVEESTSSSRIQHGTSSPSRRKQEAEARALLLERIENNPVTAPAAPSKVCSSSTEVGPVAKPY